MKPFLVCQAIRQDGGRCEAAAGLDGLCPSHMGRTPHGREPHRNTVARRKKAAERLAAQETKP